MTIASWPVVDRPRVLSAYKPGKVASAKAFLRTFKRRKWANTGGRVTGHHGSQINVYSTLNIDAARLARHGQTVAATQLARAAAELEAGPEFLTFQRLLSELSSEAAQQVIDGVLSPDVPADLVKALRALARRTEFLRSWAPTATAAVNITVGRIAEVHEGYVILALVRGSETTMVPRWMADAAKRDTVGSLLALVIDKLDLRSAVIEAVPAIAVDDEPAPGAFHPFERGDSRMHTITEADERLLAREPAPLRVLVPVTIDE